MFMAATEKSSMAADSQQTLIINDHVNVATGTYLSLLKVWSRECRRLPACVETGRSEDRVLHRVLHFVLPLINVLPTTL
jgi:hypothetical protein